MSSSEDFISWCVGFVPEVNVYWIIGFFKELFVDVGSSWNCDLDLNFFRIVDLAVVLECFILIYWLPVYPYLIQLYVPLCPGSLEAFIVM